MPAGPAHAGFATVGRAGSGDSDVPNLPLRPLTVDLSSCTEVGGPEALKGLSAFESLRVDPSESLRLTEIMID